MDATPTHKNTAHDRPAKRLPESPSTSPAQHGKRLSRRPPETVEELPYNWPIVGAIIVMHGAALAAPWVFTWQGLVLALALHWITGGIGVCLGFHRLLTHGSFQTYRPMRYLLATIGGLAGEGSALDWVAAHRKHHAFSDQEGDPHSPRDGAWWSHVLWLGSSFYGSRDGSFVQRWAPDLANDPAMRLVGQLAIPLHVLFGALLFLIGYMAGGAYLGWSLVVWGMFVRFVFVLHSTWLVNSASHMWGYRNYETADDSRNNWWVALLTYGEGWHNNHHAYPRMAKHGHRWWEIDLTFVTIRLLQRLGLVWNVVDYRKKSEQALQPHG